MAVSDFVNTTDTVAVTIANGATASGAAALAGARLVGLVTPDALTGTALTFQGSLDGVTYTDLYDVYGARLTATVAADRWIVVDPADFAGVPYIRVVSNGAEGAARSLALVVRPV